MSNIIQHVVMWSGGITSWATARIVIERYGRDSVTLLFADTNAEDDDLYRWNVDAAAKLNMELTRVADPQERDPWQVFFDVRWLGNSRLAPCSRILKQDPARQWLEDHCEASNTVVYIGIDWKETHRIPGNRAGYAHTPAGCDRTRLCRSLFDENGRLPGPGCRNLLSEADSWQVEYPLTRPPYNDKHRLRAEARALGLEEPRMYREGYEHNNCAGLCVRAGQGQWAHTLRIHPDRFAHAEEQENRFRREINPDAAILRDWSNDGKPLTLSELRRRVEASEDGEPPLFDINDIGGCGCFIADGAA